jgi:hypothetical protein
MFILLWEHKGEWHIRCKDGKWRKRAWYGTYGECLKEYKTMASAKSAQTRIHNNRFFNNPNTHFWITNLKDESCAELWQRVRNHSTGSVNLTEARK